MNFRSGIWAFRELEIREMTFFNTHICYNFQIGESFGKGCVIFNQNFFMLKSFITLNISVVPIIYKRFGLNYFFVNENLFKIIHIWPIIIKQKLTTISINYFEPKFTFYFLILSVNIPNHTWSTEDLPNLNALQNVRIHILKKIPTVCKIYKSRQ